MNKRLLAATIAVFAFIFGYDFLYHGMYLADEYQATASLWRPEASMGEYMRYLTIGQLIIAFGVVWLVFRSERGGWLAGAVTGIAIATIAAGTNLIFFAVQPLPADLVCSWITSGFIQTAIAGAIAGSIYKPEL